MTTTRSSLREAPAVEWNARDTGTGLALLAAYLLSRWLWIWINPESSSYWEEAFRWVAVEHLAAGSEISISDYQADHYQGGSLVVILLATALRLIGVDGFIALKCVALFFSGATLAALYIVGRVFFGRSVALCCGVIYLLGPPLVAFWGVVAMGFHAESVLFSIIIVGFFLMLVEETWSGPPAWFCFGLISGLGVWFTPTTGVSLVACAVAWPFLAKTPRLSSLMTAAAGFLLGLAPWFGYNLANDFAGFDRILQVFGAQPAADAWRSQGVGARVSDLFLRVPSEGLLDPAGRLPRPWPAYWIFAGVWLPAGAALIAALLRAIRVVRSGGREGGVDARREFVFISYAVVFFGVYLASRFSVDREATAIGYRLFVPVAVLLTVPIAVSLVRGLASGAVIRTCSAIACAAALASLSGATLSWAAWHTEPGTPYSQENGYVVWGRLLQHKNSSDPKSAVEAAKRIATGLDRFRILSGIGWGIGLQYSHQMGSLDELVRSLEPVAPHNRKVVVAGITAALGDHRDHIAEDLARREDPDLRHIVSRLDELSEWIASEQPERRSVERVRPSVVIITLDTTRVDHLSCYGYERETTPRLDAFAERAVRFRHAWSTSSWTLPAHASLFSGFYPSRHGAHYDQAGEAVLGDVVNLPVARHVKAGKLADDVTTLAEWLRDSGYRTGAFVAGPWLHRSFGLLQGFDEKNDRVAGFGGRPADEISDNAIGWLREIAPGEPYLLFANYFDPHAPYDPIESYPDLPRAQEPFEPAYAELMRGEATLDADQRAVLADRYDAEIRVMDRELGRLLDEVMARPGAEHTIVIITADHGESLGEEGRFGHGFWLSEELIRIPMIVRRPFDRDGGTWSEEPIQLVDVLPLLADELDLPAPEGIEGVAVGQRKIAFAELYQEATTAMRFGEQYEGDLQAAIRWPNKLLRGDDGVESLLLLSPEELTERPAAAGSVDEALAIQLDRHSESGATRAPVAPEVDQDTLDALRALGYVD